MNPARTDCPLKNCWSVSWRRKVARGALGGGKASWTGTCKLLLANWQRYLSVTTSNRKSSNKRTVQRLAGTIARNVRERGRGIARPLRKRRNWRNLLHAMFKCRCLHQIGGVTRVYKVTHAEQSR